MTRFKQAEDLLIAGVNITQVAKRLKLNRVAVCRIRRRLGLPPNKNSGPAVNPESGFTAEAHERAMVARKMRDAGLTYKQIANLLGVCAQRVLIYTRHPKFRLLIRQSNGVCQECKQKSELLHCHHLNYENQIVKVVCPACHSKIHTKTRLDAVRNHYNK